MKPRGSWYKATVPETLDLAERADLSLNVMLGNIDPNNEYSVFQGFRFDTNPPQPGSPSWNMVPKNIRALPSLRVMCGADRGLDLERDIMKKVLSQIGEDGLLYYPVTGSDTVSQGTSYPLSNGLVALAMVTWYERDKNPEWLKWIRLVSKGTERIAIKREDRAYLPLESGYGHDGQWHWTARGKAVTPYTPPDEPVLDWQGIEGAVKFESAGPLRAFLRCYQYTGDTESLEMAAKFGRFMLKPSFWLKSYEDGFAGNEHGIFAGHFHANVASLYSLLDLGLAQKDEWLKQFVREAYDHARSVGVTRMGYFPSWLMPEKCDRLDEYAGGAEACAIGDMIILAVKLSDAGLGDYWDDVDYYVRNQFAEQQITDLEQMRKMSGNDPKNDEVLKRFIGGFSGAEPTAIPPTVGGCCSANGAISLYYAWHGITRFQDGVAQVNLFLNRASPWMDIDSYLPYEGRVVLHNKLAHTALVRIPAWLDSTQMKYYVNDQQATPARAGNSLLFEQLGKNDLIRLEFPVPESQNKQKIHRTEYTLTYRGSTIVDIAPRKQDPKMCPLYQRDKMKKGTQAPLHEVERFVADNIIPLQ
jgi:hypothetical protein